MSKRCLMIYPWDLNETTGTALMLSYSRALRDAGYRLDCYAPRGDSGSTLDGLHHGVFENVFVAPDRDLPITGCLGGEDDASIVAAGVLASISDYDVACVHYDHCHSLRKVLPPDLPLVVVTHDLDSLDDQPADEAARLKLFNLVTVVGPHDGQILRSVEPGLPLVEAPYTVTLEKAAGTIHEHSPGVLLWISSAASIHRLSFLWFWNYVWPAIRLAHPQCRLVIAGRISDLAMQSGAGADPQVSVLGVVSNTSRLYRDADVLLAPYCSGLGVKTEVIEALGKGIPVATTSLGIYNTRTEPGREAVVSDQASEYASQVIELISSPARRRELARNGHEYVGRRHDRRTSLQPLIEAFARICRVKKTSAKSRASIQRELDKPLRHLARLTARHCKTDNIRAVALYGAGSHTEWLVPIWEALGAPEIRRIVVSGEPAEPFCMGVPVVSAADFDAADVDAIVLSSCDHEQPMAATCRQRWPELKVYPIWKPIPASRDFEPVCNETIPAEIVRPA